MFDKGIFVFGNKIFVDEIKKDAITCLPLEVSWKIFSYLDDISLRIASKVNKTWNRIIISNKRLRKRLNLFELSIRLGSKSLAKFHRKNMRKLKKEKVEKNYVLRGMSVQQWTSKTVKSKRNGEEIIVHTKRFRLH